MAIGHNKLDHTDLDHTFKSLTENNNILDDDYRERRLTTNHDSSN